MLRSVPRTRDGYLSATRGRPETDADVYRHVWPLRAVVTRVLERRHTPGSAWVRVSARRRLPARADDRDLGTTPIEVVVVASALRVVVAPPEDRVSAADGGPALTP